MENAPAVQEQNTKDIAIVNGVFEPKSFDELWRVACLFADSGMMPKQYENKPKSIMVAGQFGAQLGLPLMSAVQNIAVVNGNPTLWGDSQKALVQDSGTLEVFVEYFDGKEGDDSFTAICIAKRKGVGFEYKPDDDLNTMRRKGLYVNEFSVSDAKRAGVWGGTGKEKWQKESSAWFKHPKRMLKMRARAFTLRDGWPDILKGMHSAEEMMGESVVTLKQNDLGTYEAGSEPAPSDDLKDKDTSLYTQKAKPVEPVEVKPELVEPDPVDQENTKKESPAETSQPEQFRNSGGNSRPPAGVNLDGSKWEEPGPAEKQEPDWDPRKEPVMQRYVAEKAQAVKKAAEEIGISVAGLLPREVHQRLLDSLAKPEETPTEEEPKAPEKTDDLPEGASTREQFFHILQERGYDDEKLSMVNDCIQHHTEKTGLAPIALMKQWMTDINKFLVAFESWRLPEAPSEDEEPEKTGTDELRDKALKFSHENEGHKWTAICKTAYRAGMIKTTMVSAMSDVELQAMIDEYEKF